jgi:tetratricopeptide (TPR) repeat protein
MLCDKFLDGALKDRGLAAVAEIAANEVGQLVIQKFVYDLFESFGPSSFHQLLPTFRWWALATTNYDLVIERAYREVGSLQNLVKRFKDGDGFDQRLRQTIQPLEYIKLHGCIEHYTDDSIPLILGHEQYAHYLKNRTRLYSRLRDLAHEHPLIFCGYRIEDPHIQQILFDLADSKVNRPMYFHVSPGIDDYEIRYWAKHNVTAVRATFKEFLESLDVAIPASFRKLASGLGGGELSIRNHYKVAGATESTLLRNFLEVDVLHLRGGMPIEPQVPREFYKGYDTGWGCISQLLDVRRALCDSVLVDAVLVDEDQRKPVEFFVLLGPAGNGKTVALKRIAWETSQTYGQLTFYLHETGTIKVDALEEIYRLTGKRIFLFLDRVSLKRQDVTKALSSCQAKRIALTVIGTERNSEWNAISGLFSSFLCQEFSVHYLSAAEVTGLIDLLTKHNALGLLADKTRPQQIDAFIKRAQRQLLVALHEATLGLPFQTILKDEYESIPSPNAKALYLAICTLNQFGAPVRAGLISRATGIEFLDFQSKLLEPLEHIVFVEEDRYSKDYLYRARHQHVAEVVFNQVLTDQEARFDMIVTLLQAMNPDYVSDAETFGNLIRGRQVVAMFPSVELGRLLFDAAETVSRDDSHVLHQRAIFEIRHPGGSLERAEKYAHDAFQLRGNRSINHTRADIARKQANQTDDPLKREAFRRTARNLLTVSSNDEYYLHTKALLAIDELTDLIATAKSNASKGTDRAIVDATKEVETAIQRGLQAAPDSPEMRTAEALFRETIDQDGLAEIALKKAFDLNPRQDWLAAQLARRFIAKGDPKSAIETLLRCLAENPSSKIAHLATARTMMASTPNSATIIEHLKASFSSGDDNFEVQFWYARELFIRGLHDLSEKLFSSIDERAPSTFRRVARDEIQNDDGSIRMMSARILRIEEGYAFVRFDSYACNVFASRGDSEETEWNKVKANGQVRASIAFTRRGARAGGLVAS